MKSAPAVLLCFLFAACSQTQQPAKAPILILRFENLTGDPALEWMGRGAARQIAAQIDGAAIADVGAPELERERAIARGAARILHGYISRFGDRLRLRTDLEDTASAHFVQAAESAGPLSSGLVPLAAAVARQFDPGAHSSGTKSEAALEAYISGLGAADSAAAADLLNRSIAADPDFGAAYLALIELAETRRDRAAVEQVVARARARGSGISVLDRARLSVAAAQVSGDPSALFKSLNELSRLTPSDSNLLRTLANTEMQARHYGPAIEYFKRVLAAQPGDAAILNLLGYTQAYAGDLESAVKTMREYERIHPADANPLDSLGDVNFYFGHFPEAEQFYLQSYAKDAAFLNGAGLVKAATAHLLTGDIAGAEAIFADYEKARRVAGDPVIDFTRAEWDRLRGKRREAIRNLEALAAATRFRDLSSLAHASLTVWLLDGGDRERARQHAKQAAETASGQGTANLAAVCRYTVDPAGGSSSDPLVRAQALLLSQNFGGAIPLLREVLAHSTPNPSETAPVLLAWALEETGQIDEAEKYLRNTPVPAALGTAPFDALIFPRIFHLRAVVAEKKGEKVLAEQNSRLFAALSGPKA